MKSHKSAIAAIRTVTIIASFTSIWLGIPNAAIGAQSDQQPLAQWASSATATSQYSDTDWSASQAIGTPNVTGCGDNGRAWASQDKGGKDDLTLGFDVPVIPSQLKIYETYNPGSITGVTLVPADGGELINIAKSADTGTACPGVFTLAITGISTAVNGVIIHLNQAKIGNWNEIDAVQLIGAPSAAVISQWATAATASSQFGAVQWAASQATGAPNVKTCGDNTSAWASSAKSSKETLTLTFSQAVIPSGVKIYETYNPGSITSVDLVPADGSKAIPVAKSTDGGTSCPGVFSLSIAGVSALVNGVVIHLDQSKIGNWDEIDAVPLIGQFTNTASASATAAATVSATAAATTSATAAVTTAPSAGTSSPTAGNVFSAGGVTLTVPDGWVVQNGQGTSGVINFADDQPSMTAIQTGQPIPGPLSKGQFGGSISILPTAMVSEVPGLTADATPVDFMAFLVKQLKSAGQALTAVPTTLTIGAYPAARLQDKTGQNSVLILVIKADQGYIAALAFSPDGELANAEPTLQTMLKSITLKTS